MSASTMTALNPKTAKRWIAGWAEKVSGLLTSESASGYRLGAIILAVILAPVAVLQCILGAPPIAGPWDVMILLDGAWRIVHGQVPNTDFYNPIGPMTDLLIAFGLKVASPSTSAITYGLILMTAIMVPLTWRIAKNRLPWALALLCALLTGSYLLSPRPPGYTLRDTTYAMIYNRESYVVFIALCLCLFLTPRILSRRSVSFDGVCVGVLLALLLYWKVTYFVAAVGITMAAMILVPRARNWWLAATGGFAGVCISLFALFRISLFRYLADLLYAIKAQSPAMRYKLLWAGITNNAMWMYLLCFCLVLLSWAWGSSNTTRFSIARIWLVVLSLVGAALFIESGNSAQGGGIDDPLYFTTAVIAVELFRRLDSERVAEPGSSLRLAYTGSLALLLPLFWGTIMGGDLVSYAYTVAWDFGRRPHTDASQSLHSTTLSDFHVPPGTDHVTNYWPAREFPARINDGIDLLKRNLRDGESVMTLDYANPFSFALGIKPGSDRILFWDQHVTFDVKNAPPAEDFLGRATVVMVPRLLDRRIGFGFPTFDTLMALYGGYLHQHFHEVESTETWTLYRRN
jgi:hypothetical protein